MRGGKGFGTEDTTLSSCPPTATRQPPREGVSEASASRAAIGSRIGRYVVLSRIGAGGMGEVLSGYDEELDRRVALKLVRAELAGDGTGRARMQREAQALARLSHPNVVQVHDVGVVDGELFIAMEYVRGESLLEWQLRLDPEVESDRRAIVAMYVQAGRGLAAAHEAEIVHRDFKPTNVLIGVDGRARVVDFGLAVGRRVEATMESTEEALSLGIDELTRAGTMLGTPAYMAPEQFLGGVVDGRTDVFAFSIALYEALFDEAPFPGETLEERRSAVVDGRLRTPSSAKIPAWLRAAVLRGLARRPEDRYPTMAAMIEALTDDPIERRRLRLRLVGLASAALVLGALLLSAGLWGLERWQEREAEAAASARLITAQARIDALARAGAEDEADRVFRAFVDHADNRGRAALGAAWLDWAARARAREDVAGAIDALAAAYVVATRGEEQVRALLEMATIFRDQMNWRGLVRVLATLDARARESGARGDAGALRLDAALVRRDLAAAVELLNGPLAGTWSSSSRSVLASLRGATRSELRHRGLAEIADVDGDGAPELVLETNARDRQLAPILRADLALTPLGEVDLGTGTFRALAPGPGEPAILLANEETLVDGVWTREAVALRLRGGAREVIHRWPGGQIMAALGVDVDGDGARELLVGTGPYTRSLIELVPGAIGGWTLRSPSPALDRRLSDVVSLLADDLDGDGRIEVIAGLGPWIAYELHVLRHDPTRGELRTVTRRRLGNISGAALVRGPGGAREIVLSKTDEYPSALVFPPERPYGEAAGTYFFRLDGDALQEVAFAPAPRLAGGARVSDRRPLVGDLDGDGVDEVIVSREVVEAGGSTGRDATVILVRGAEGAVTPLVLGELRPIAAIDLDHDRDAELIVSRSDDADRVWVLGSGEGELPALEVGGREPGDAPPLADPGLTRIWRHAQDLAAIGLGRPAAEALQMLAHLAPGPWARARVQAEAAAIFEAEGDDARAAELFAAAAHAPRLGRQAHEGAARTRLRLAQIDAAADHLEAVARLTSAPPVDLAAAIGALRAGPEVELTFARPLPPLWRIAEPLALRRDGAAAALHVEVLTRGELLSAPARWTGESLAIEVEVDVARAEWGSRLEVGLIAEGGTLSDGTSPLGVAVATRGGATEHVHEIGCMAFGEPRVTRIPVAPGEALGRLTIRALLLPALGEWICAVERPGAATLLYTRAPILEARGSGGAPLRLSLTGAGTAWIAADLRRIRVTGADVRPAEEATASTEEARRSLVEDEVLAALDALRRDVGSEPRERLLEVVALARLGRLDEAVQVLTPLLAEGPDAAAIEPAIESLLRSDAAVFGALVRAAAGPAEARRRLAGAWGMAVLMHRDPRACAVVWAGLADRDLDADAVFTLRVHAAAAALLGHPDAAAASYRAALRALDDPTRRAAALAIASNIAERGGLHIELAALALAAGDEEGARRELAPLLAGEDADLSVVDRVRARADLRPLWEEEPRR